MGGRHCLVATMKLLLLVFVISSAAALETYTETRDITDSAGSTFSCLYTIVYDASRKVVYRKQSSVQCNPDTNGKQTTEDIIIAAAGMSVAVTYQRWIDGHDGHDWRRHEDDDADDGDEGSLPVHLLQRGLRPDGHAHHDGPCWPQVGRRLKTIGKP